MNTCYHYYVCMLEVKPIMINLLILMDHRSRINLINWVDEACKYSKSNYYGGPKGWGPGIEKS